MPAVLVNKYYDRSTNNASRNCVTILVVIQSMDMEATLGVGVGWQI